MQSQPNEHPLANPKVVYECMKLTSLLFLNVMANYKKIRKAYEKCNDHSAAQYDD